MAVTKKTSMSSCSKIINVIMLCTYSFFMSSAKSEVIPVGGENRWTDGFDYIAWAQQFHFNVGDVLEFRYTKGKHTVYDVSQAAFQTCNTSNGVNAMYNSGNDQVELKEAKQYWFICTVELHCSMGQKFSINVSQVTTNFSPTPNCSNQNSVSTKHISSWIYLLALAAGILYMPIIIA